MAQTFPTPLPLPPAAASPVPGMAFAAAGMALYSVNDMAIKQLSGGYALHQIILIRALVAMVVVLVFIGQSKRGFAQLRSHRLGSHILRASVIVVSNVCYYLGLGSMPFADAAAVSYTSPLIVTALSVLALGERVGPRRWSAVAVGMIGTLIMLRPGAGMIEIGAVLVLLSSLLYAISNLMTRQMRQTETAAAFSFYTVLAFIIACSLMGLVTGDGKYASADSVLGFLFRPWIWPPVEDWALLLLTGVAVSLGGMMVAQAYRTTEAALVAPFDYTGMPLALFWGVAIFGTWPDLHGWIGIALICGSGIYVIWREAALARKVPA